MKVLEGIFEWFNFIFGNQDDYSDGYTEYLSEQPGTYVDTKELY